MCIGWPVRFFVTLWFGTGIISWDHVFCHCPISWLWIFGSFMSLTTFYHCTRGASFKIYPLTFKIQNKGLSISCNTYKKLCPFHLHFTLRLAMVATLKAGGNITVVSFNLENRFWHLMISGSNLVTKEIHTLRGLKHYLKTLHLQYKIV